MDETINLVEVIINNKKLHFNNIWSSKITQEDILTIKPLDNLNENLILINIIFNSILVFTKKINEMLQDLSNRFTLFNSYEKDTIICNIIAFIKSLQLKISSFDFIRNKSFKVNTDNLVEVKKLLENIEKIKSEKGSELILEIYVKLSEFYDIIIKYHSV